ncbi:hypothetical protein [Pectobacterium polaris]|uniref:hypothetical protein n=1 Tax=Pectobacterium polaris TaxID=2042057 RepID=UPI001CF20CDA|nr:hypothetical protein [Pectobacterium polaris]MCA6954035.1 hypothetical protein [Pectobacterium polaris]
MLEKYLSVPLGLDEEEHKRVIAVNAALELIKAAIETDAGDRNMDYELNKLREHIPSIADAIQAALKDK